jgi:hypothetical protein
MDGFFNILKVDNPTSKREFTATFLILNGTKSAKLAVDVAIFASLGSTPSSLATEALMMIMIIFT